MNKLDLFLLGVIIGCVAILTLTFMENKDLHKRNEKLISDNNYYKWQLNEVPTIIESNKEEICK
jgi:hypothetical protein